MNVNQIIGDTFIFIYGGTDPKWTHDFALAIEKIKRHEITRKADAVIEHFHFEKRRQKNRSTFLDWHRKLICKHDSKETQRPNNR